MKYFEFSNQKFLFKLHTSEKLKFSKETLTNIHIDNIDDCFKKLNHILNNGWFCLLIDLSNNSQYLLNDLISSFRIYIKPETNEWSLDFWKLCCKKENLNIDEVLNRGYLTYDNTISNNVKKILPSHYYNFSTKKQVFYRNIFRNNSIKQNLIECFHLKNLDIDQNIAIAFSGGLDSTFLAEITKNKFKKVTLFYMFSPEIDSEAQVNLIQSQEIAKKLNLELKIINISANEIFLNIEKYIKLYPNDFSIGFVALKIFIKKIANYKYDILITGQNSDTFISYGLTRKFHLIETLSRLIFKKIFRKMYYSNKINFIEKFILNITYKLRSINTQFIPRTKNELIIGLSYEKYYLPIFDYSKNNLALKYSNMNYDEAIVYNKLINHIAGNHSLVWSNEELIYIYMPFSSIDYINYCIINSRNLNIYNPKKILENNIKFKFTRKKISIFYRIKVKFKKTISTRFSNFKFIDIYNNILKNETKKNLN